MAALDELYKPPVQEVWQGRIDEGPHRRFHQAVTLVNLQESPTSFPPHALGILGFASDAGILRNQGQGGAADGPRALRASLAKLPFPSSNQVLCDFGDVVCLNNRLEEAQQLLSELVALLHQQQVFPILFGGGHEIAWAHYLGLTRAYPQKKIGIINFDAHFDLRIPPGNSMGNSGTPFLQIAELCSQQNLPFDYLCLGIQPSANSKDLFDKARELNVQYITAEEINLQPHENIKAKLTEFLVANQQIYLTLCLDVFAAAFAPGVSAPQPLGLLPWQVIPLLRCIADSRKVVALDIAELSPPRDRDSLTSNLAANLLFHYLRN